MSKLAIYFPGIGYHCDKPLLYYSRSLARELGYQECRNISYTYEGKNIRPVLMNNPLDEAFDRLFKEASHRKGVRRFVSSWHKRRMVGAIYAGNYLLMCREFFIAFRLYPLQRKLYTSLLLSFFSRCTGKDLYSINRILNKKKRT